MLALIDAADFGWQSELNLAHLVMEDCSSASSKLQYAFLSRVCESGHIVDVAVALDSYSQQADQHVHLYSTVLERVAWSEIEGIHVSVHPL